MSAPTDENINTNNKKHSRAWHTHLIHIQTTQTLLSLSVLQLTIREAAEEELQVVSGEIEGKTLLCNVELQPTPLTDSSSSAL